jgi:thiol-disulfide isomerase/thioredoxin
MKPLIVLFALTGALLFGSAAQAQKIASYNSEQFLQRISNKDTVYIVNFWATWCVPCVKELPAFNILHDLYKGKPVKVILMSFDFKEQYPEQLQNWVKKKKLRPEVVWFNESNPTTYIPKIAPEWEGGLPVTLLINNGNGARKVIPNEITADEIKQWVSGQLSP